MNKHLNAKCKDAGMERLVFGSFGALLAVTVVSGAVMTGDRASADSTTTKTSAISVNVASACTMESNIDDAHSRTVNPGQFTDEIGTTSTTVICNNYDGYAIYAIGYGNNTLQETRLLGASSGTNIATHDRDESYTSTSHWYMKLMDGTGTSATINSPYSNYSAVPSDYTKVAYSSSATAGSGGSSFRTTYGAYVATGQSADTYTGKVKYTLVNPHTSDDRNAPSTTDTINSIAYLQDINSSNKQSIMDSMTTDEQYTLVDSRDNKEYFVAKLQDGKIWMTQNLDLNLKAAEALTSENTDLTVYDSGPYTSANGYAQSNGVISWTPSKSTTSAVTDASTTVTFSWPNSQTVLDSLDPGNWYWSGEYYPSGNCPSNAENNYLGCNYITKSPSNYSGYFSTTPYTLNGKHGHVGNYYNWTAAIATNNSSSYGGTAGENASNSICPSGWRLPNGTATYTAGEEGNNDFYNLDLKYNNGLTNKDEGLIAAPTYFARAGNVNSSALHSAGYVGVYWSSTVESSSGARGLNFNSGWVNPTNQNNRSNGFSVRCVVR